MTDTTITPRHDAERPAPATGAFDWVGERRGTEPFGAPTGVVRSIRRALRGTTADRRRSVRS